MHRKHRASSKKHEKKSKKKHKKEKRSRRSRSPSENTRDSVKRERRLPKRHKRSRSRSRSRARGRSKSHRSSSSCELAAVDSIVLPANSEGDDDLFAVDRTGDRDNNLYGSVYSGDQPLYELATRRVVGTRVWTTQSRGATSRAGMEDRRKRAQERQQAERYFSMEARQTEQSGQRRLYLAYSERRRGHNRASQSREMDFIPVDPIVDGDTERHSEDIPDSDNEGESVFLTDAQNTEQFLVSRTKQFSAAVTATPDNVNAWLDFIAFQEETLQLVQAKDKKTVIAAQRNVHDKQKAILQRALDSNPTSRELHRVKINLALHDHAFSDHSGLDGRDTTLQLIESLIERDPTNEDLWLKLVESRQQNFSSFSVSAIRDMFARIISVFRRQREHIDSKEAKTALSVQLTYFLSLLCTFEQKTGHNEHAIARLSALIDLNGLNAKGCELRELSHYQLVSEFSSRWNHDVSRFGEVSKLDNEDLHQLLVCNSHESRQKLLAYVEQTCVKAIKSMNPPDAISTEEHKQRLIASSATFQRRLHRIHPNETRILSVDVKESEDSSHDFANTAEQFIYSNLHGYRIKVDEMNDSHEYEKILSELRDTDTSRARQELQETRSEKRWASLADAVEKTLDQRSEFDSIPSDDPFAVWVASETRERYLNWQPLWPSNEAHQDLIKAAPDRAILTDELLPFLFDLSPKYQWSVIRSLFKVCGVHLEETLPYDTVYEDAFETDYQPLVKPLLRAFDPSCSKPLALSSTQRLRKLTNSTLRRIRVEDVVVFDSSRIAFIRQVFAQSIGIFGSHVNHNSSCDDGPSLSTIKSLWIAFESELEQARRKSLSYPGKEDSIEFARSLSQILLQNSPSNNNLMEMRILFEYALLEFRLGNKRQVERIFETTLKALRSEQSDRNIDREFHRFVYLRTRSELWNVKRLVKDVSKKPVAVDESRTAYAAANLRALYILWCVWQPSHEPLEQLVKIHRKNSKELVDKHLGHLQSPGVIASLETKYRSELEEAIRDASSHCSNSHCTDSVSLETSAPPCIVGFCLHNLALAMYCSRGLNDACDVYHRYLGIGTHPQKLACKCLNSRWVWLTFLEFLQQHENSLGAFPKISPRKWRHSVESAVRKFPQDPLLLRLFVDAETGTTMSQALRSHFLRVEKTSRRHFDSPHLNEWLFMLLGVVARVERAASKAVGATLSDNNCNCCLFHKWGANRPGIDCIRAAFESMVSQVRTRGSALAWRLYLRFEISLGRVDAAKKVFYRALARAPWSKELYLDSVRVLRPYLSDDESQQIIGLMEAKELHVRVKKE